MRIDPNVHSINLVCIKHKTTTRRILQSSGLHYRFQLMTNKAIPPNHEVSLVTWLRSFHNHHAIRKTDSLPNYKMPMMISRGNNDQQWTVGIKENNKDNYIIIVDNENTNYYPFQKAFWTLFGPPGRHISLAVQSKKPKISSRLAGISPRGNKGEGIVATFARIC